MYQGFVWEVSESNTFFFASDLFLFYFFKSLSNKRLWRSGGGCWLWGRADRPSGSTQSPATAYERCVISPASLEDLKDARQKASLSLFSLFSCLFSCLRFVSRLTLTKKLKETYTTKRICLVVQGVIEDLKSEVEHDKVCLTLSFLFFL